MPKSATLDIVLIVYNVDVRQLYVSFASGVSAAALNGLQSCLASVQSWMSTDKLKLNPDKTEFLLIENERQRSKYLSMFPIELLGVKTNPAKSARNLGVIFDKYFTFRSHISVVWIVQNCLLLLSFPVVSIIVIHFRMIFLTLTAQGFKRVQNQLAPPGDKVSSIYSQYSTASFSSLVASKV